MKKRQVLLVSGTLMFIYGLYGALSGSILVPTKRQGIVEFEGEGATFIGLAIIIFSLGLLYYPLMARIIELRHSESRSANLIDRLVSSLAKNSQLNQAAEGAKFYFAFAVLVISLYGLYVSVIRFAP